jgi:ATP-dependent helicase/nuclease subunit A
LQLLPDVEPANRMQIAAALLDRDAALWPAGEREAALGEVFALLDDPAHGVLFGPRSRAEASVAGNVRIGGREVLVTGQIDRLAVTPSSIEIADYNTNREVPATAEDAPLAYVLQLALYRELMRQIYPGRTVACRLIWTRNGAVTAVSDAAMDRALAAMTIP